MIKIAVTGIVSVIAILTLKGFDKAAGAVCTLAAGIIILAMSFPKLSEVYEMISSVSEKSGINLQEVAVLVKILGISLITEFAADLCSDAGESSVAKKVQFAGKIAVVASSIPIINSLVQLVVRIAS